MTENDRHMYNAHLQLLHAHLGEKSIGMYRIVNFIIRPEPDSTG